MASENDMRRHTTFIEPNLSTTTETPNTAEFPSNLEPAASRNGVTGEGGESISRISSVPDRVRASTSNLAAVADDGNEAPNGAGGSGAGRKSDLLDRPESPPVQEETTKHNRFSMLRFRTASDSQLSARSKLQQEKPPPMPQRTRLPSPFLSRPFYALPPL